MKKKYIIVLKGLFEYGYYEYSFKSGVKKYTTDYEARKEARKFYFKFYANFICKMLNYISEKECTLRTFYVQKLEQE